MERGEISAEAFMEGIADMSRALIKEHTAPEERFAGLFPDAKGTRREAVGTCPRCGGTVYEGKKGFSVKIGTAPLPSGKITNSLQVRRKP